MKCPDCKVNMKDKGNAKIYKDANRIVVSSFDCNVWYCNRCGQIRFYSQKLKKKSKEKTK